VLGDGEPAAEPVLAEPVLAEPVLAEPVLAGPVLAIVTVADAFSTARHGPAHPGPVETTSSPPARVTSRAGAATGAPPGQVATRRPPPSADAMAL
jgi:hypothetical protein